MLPSIVVQALPSRQSLSSSTEGRCMLIAHRHNHNFHITIDTTVIIDIMFRSAPSAKREEVNLADKRGSRRSFNCCPVLWHEAHAHRYHKKSTMILFSLLSTADANMISAASPIWTAIMARFILKEKQLQFLLMDSHLSVHSSLFRSLLASQMSSMWVSPYWA